MKKLLVTSGLPYSNGRLHVGHIAGAYLPADIYVRYQRMCGRDVRFICGSDDHGVAIMLSADKEGQTPAELSKRYHDQQARDFKGLNINFDVYGATSRSQYHPELSQEMFLKLYEKGYFEKQSSKQFFDEERQMFLPDRFVQGTCAYCDTPDQNGDQCENCGKILDVEHLKDARSVVSGNPASVKETVHWFLDLSRFEQPVSNWINTATLRNHTRNYVNGLLGSGFIKRSMTRDIDWGIPVPLEDPDASGKVLYVWFDAPIGYISFTKQLCAERDSSPETFVDWWKADDCEVVHFIGEDNTVFHCVIWIAMLSAEGSYSLPSAVVVNQFLNIQFPGQAEQKISKSRGTAVWIQDYLAEGWPVDPLRYYLTAIAPERARTVYNPADLIQRNNTDLANTFGNFVNRILSFTSKHFGPSVPGYSKDSLEKIDADFLESRIACHKTLTDQLDKFMFKDAQETLMEFVRSCNKYVDDRAPWKTRKDDEERTKATLAVCIQAIAFLSVVWQPFLPDTAAKIRQMLSLEESPEWSEALSELPSGSPLGEPQILFTKLDQPE